MRRLPLQHLPFSLRQLRDRAVSALVAGDHGAEAERAHVLFAGQTCQASIVLAHGGQTLGAQAREGVSEFLGDIEALFGVDCLVVMMVAMVGCGGVGGGGVLLVFELGLGAGRAGAVVFLFL